MANIIVVGDSWSTDCLRPNVIDDWVNNYAGHHSISNRLRNLGHTVLTVAKGGSSIGSQLDWLEFYFNEYNDELTHIDGILIGWTEWGRELYQCSDTKGWVRKENGHLTDISSSLKIAQDRVSSQLYRLSNRAQEYNIKWMHWGGLSSPWIDLPDDHYLLYKDYCLSEFRCPPRNQLNLTFTTRGGARKNLIKQRLQKYFPNSDTEIIKKYARDTAIVQKFCCNNNNLFPDLGHLSFRHYGPLVNKVNEYMESKNKNV